MKLAPGIYSVQVPLEIKKKTTQKTTPISRIDKSRPEKVVERSSSLNRTWQRHLLHLLTPSLGGGYNNGWLFGCELKLLEDMILLHFSVYMCVCIVFDVFRGVLETKPEKAKKHDLLNSSLLKQITQKCGRHKAH